MNKMWKRSLSLFLAIVMIVGVVPMNVFATEQECAHENVEYIDEPATCIWEGYYAEYCNDCQQYLVEELLPAAGHDWSDGVCTACGEAAEAEEPVETPDAETDEEPAEEETPDEEEPVALNPVEAPVAYAATREENGVILHGNNAWLDKNRDNDLMTSVMKGGLKTMVLDALNTTGDKVYYVSSSGKYDVTSLTDLASMYEELKDVLTGQSALRFQVAKNGSIVKDEYVTLRNIAHLEFSIDIPVVANEGKPANLKAAVETAMKNAVITVTHGGDVIDHEMMSGKLIDIDYIIPEDIDGQWPAAAKTAVSDFAVKVTIYDSVDQTTKESGIAYVTLKDTTPTYTVTFNSNGAAWKQFNVIKGEELPTVGKPNRLYYKFNGWDKAVETTVTADAVYEAQWIIDPAFDVNGNGKPDPTEYYSIKYLVDAEASEAYYSETARFGTKTPMPETNPEKPSYAEEGKSYIFLGWKPQGSTDRDAVVAATVTGHATYVGRWEEAAGQAVITFTKNRVNAVGDDGVDTWPETTKTDGILAENPMDYSGEGKEWTGWYVAGADGNASGYQYDFTKTIDEQLEAIEAAGGVVDGNKVSLVGTLGVDAGGRKGKIDGTEEDPYTKYIFQWMNGDAWEDLFKPAADYLYDESTRVDLTDLETYFDPADDNQNDKLHIGWAEVSASAVYSVREFKADYSKTVYLRPVYADDYNNNDVDDANESAKFTVNNDAWGTVEVPNHTVTDGKFLANTNGQTAGKNGYETKLVVTPTKGANSFVSKILINNVEQDITIEDDGTAWILLHKADLSGAKEAGQTEALNIEVVLETMEIKFKAAPDAGVLIPGKTYTEADVEAVYDAVVEGPARGDAKVSVSYVARKAEKGITVDVSALRKDIEARYSKLSSRILDKVWPGDTVTVDLTEVVNPISYQHDGMVMNPQQVVDSYILELQGADIAELMGVLATLDLTIQAKVRERANIRPFMYNANGSEFEETLVVNYVGNKQDLTNSVTYPISDSRSKPTITASNKTVTVGAYTDAKLLVGVTMDPAVGEVKLADSFENRNARTYKGVPVYFAGNESYKPASAKFNLTINKAKLNKFDIENVIVEPANNASYAYKCDPDFGTNEKDDVQYISVIAGLDLNDVDLDLAASKPIVNLKNMKAKAWIHLPDYLETALQILGVDTSAKAKRNMEQIEDLFEEHKDALIQNNVPEKAINAMLKVLRKVNEYAAADAELEVIFTEDAAPLNPGVYANVAVVADPRFETEIDFGAVMVAPVVALPDRGNVQLTYPGHSGKVFYFESDGTDKALTVTYNGTPVDAEVFYFGLNSKLAVQSGTDADDVPNLPGIYLASTVYIAEDENGDITRLGSDVALVIIGLKSVEFDIVSDIVEEKEGVAYRPEINVSDPAAAYTLISAEVMVEADGDINLDDVKGVVNIEFPNKMYELWTSFAAEYNKDTKLPDLPTDLTAPGVKIDPQDLVDFLNWCEDRLNGNLLNQDVVNAINKLSNKLPKYADHISDVKENYKKVLDQLQAAAAKLHTAAEKMQTKLENNQATVDELVTITFQPGKTYAKNGVYYFFGVVTDPDFMPTANGGVLIIKSPDSELVLLDTHVPYDGTGKKPMGWDNTNREGITFVVDQENKTVTFFMDNTAKAAVAELEAVVGGSLHGKTVAQMYRKGEDKVEALVEKICNGIKNKAIDRIPEGTAQDKVNEMIAKIDGKLPGLNTKLSNKLEELRTNGYTILMAEKLEEPLPTEVGTYKFFSYSYAIEVAKADLVIEPIYVEVTAQDDTKVYDGLEGKENLKAPIVSYYSYSYVEGQNREDGKVAVSLPIGDITESSIDLQVSTSCDAGKNVGTYDIVVEAVVGNTHDGIIADEVKTNNAKLTITARPIKVQAEDASKFFGNADPESYAYEVVEGSIIEGDVLSFKVTRAPGENVDTYNLAIEMTQDNKNYAVELVDDGVFTINPAQITVTANNVDKQFDLEDDFANEYTYEVKEGLGTYTPEQIEQLLKEMNVHVERKEPKPDDEKVGDTAVLVVEYNNNDNVIITPVEGTLTIGYGDYVCWNTRTGKHYDVVQLAILEAVANGDTVEMLKDSDQREKTDKLATAGTIIIYDGVTLDLATHKLTADYVVGFNGGYLTGDWFVANGNYAKLDVDKDHLILGEKTLQVGVYKMLPVYDNANSCYVLSRFGLDFSTAKQGLYIDAENQHIEFIFGHKADANAAYFKADGGVNTAVKMVVEMRWKSGQGVAFQNFEYTYDQVKTVAGGHNSYTFNLEKYEAMGVKLEDVIITAKVVTDSGAVAESKPFTVADNKLDTDKPNNEEG